MWPGWRLGSSQEEQKLAEGGGGEEQRDSVTKKKKNPPAETRLVGKYITHDFPYRSPCS
jgi:hypothetical protein